MKELSIEEKQGEQKIPKFKVGDFIQFKGMGHTRYTVKEVCGLSHYINTFNKRMDMSYTDANFELVEQKPAEWSEEDEERLRDIINELVVIKEDANVRCSERALSDIIADINWLKSLRPQSSWKPSDEQMEAMQKALVDLCGKNEHNIITGLYYDLKKLKD